MSAPHTDPLQCWPTAQCPGRGQERGSAHTGLCILQPPAAESHLGATPRPKGCSLGSRGSECGDQSCARWDAARGRVQTAQSAVRSPALSPSSVTCDLGLVAPHSLVRSLLLRVCSILQGCHESQIGKHQSA